MVSGVDDAGRADDVGYPRGAATPKRGLSAVDLFNDLAAQMGGPDPHELERICAAHPEHASEVRSLFAIWRLLLDRLPDVAPASAASLTVLLGGGGDFCEVSLDEEARAQHRDWTRELLRRLVEHRPQGERYVVQGHVGKG